MTYFDFEKHLARQAEFSKKTFGPGDRLISVVDHIQKELIEVLTAKNIAERQNEWIDVVILALDGALRSRMTPQQIIDGIVSKQTKNEARKWPDWRTAEPHKAIEHEKEGKAMTDYNELVKVLNSHRLYIAADAIEEQAEAIKAQAKEIGFLKEEISIWQSVFPDIAPEQVTRDKSVVEAENAKLRTALKFYAHKENWRSKSSGFALQYDPELSETEKDRGLKAIAALKETTPWPQDAERNHGVSFCEWEEEGTHWRRTCQHHPGYISRDLTYKICSACGKPIRFKEETK